MRKPFKIVKRDNGEIHLFGNHHWKKLDYKIPDWNKEEENPGFESCFNYLGRTYFLSEFMRVDSFSPFYKLGGIDFHEYLNDSFFSGILVHYSNCGDGIKVYTYIS